MSDELKTQLALAHEAVFAGLLDATEGLDDGGWSTPTGCPGWDVHDQLAHTVGVERLMLGDPAPAVELPELDHVDDAFSRAVEVDVHARRGVPGDDLRREASETFDRRLAMLRSLAPGALDEPMDGPGGLRMKGSQMLRTRVFDLVCHEQDIRRALDRPAPLDGPAGDIAREQVLRAWAKLLPERLEQRGTLVIEMTGRSTTRRAVALGGSDVDEARPRAVLRSSGPALLALACGRSDAPGSDDLEMEGDAALVRAVVARAGITP